MALREIVIVKDATSLAREAADRIEAGSAGAIAGAGRFSIALSGGNTPRAVYELLAAAPARDRIDWTRWEVYFGDERTVPPDHVESNYRMAYQSLLSKVPLPAECVHRMMGENPPEQAAVDYGRLLKDRFGDGGPDLVMLGMGDDGHTASLFPYTAALAEAKHRCVANWVEKLQSWRLTMTAPFINRAAMVMILVSGAGKADRVAEVIEGPRDPQRLPIQSINPNGADAKLLWLLDEPAAVKLKSRAI